MLVKLTTKTNDIWVNPLHVRLVRPKRNGTDLVLAHTWTVRVDQPAEEVATLISASLPAMIPFVPDDTDDAGGDAAVVATMG
jgi:hypothetical protein